MDGDILVEMLYQILKAIVGCIAWQITLKCLKTWNSEQKDQQASGKDN